jgi:hypothetical protein
LLGGQIHCTTTVRRTVEKKTFSSEHNLLECVRQFPKVDS